MNQAEFQTLIIQERDRIDVPPVSPTGLIVTGRRRLRHRRQGIGALALVVALTGAVSFALGSSPGHEQPSPQPIQLVPPEGTRYVGIGRAVVAVPASWSSSERDCAREDRPAVVFDASSWERCQAVGGNGQASVELLDPADVPKRVAAMPLHTTVNGIDVQRSPFRRVRHSGFAGSLGLLHHPEWSFVSASLAAPSLGFLATVEAPDRATVTRILSSLQALPEGVVLVPPVQYDAASDATGQLTSKGLEPTVVNATSLYAPGIVIDLTPGQGEPVAVGATVTVTRSTGPDGPVISNRELRRVGIIVTPIGDEQPTYPKAEVLTRLRPDPSHFVTQLVLKRISTDTMGAVQPDGSLRRTIDHRLVWIAMTHSIDRNLTVYDAHTGHVLFGMSF